MTASQLFSTYLSMNLLIGLALFLGLLIPFIFKYVRKPLLRGAELKIQYSLLSAIIVIGFASPFFPKEEIFAPLVKVWSPQSNFVPYPLQKEGYGYVDLPLRAVPMVQLSRVYSSFVGAVLLVFVLGLGKFILDLFRLVSVKNESFVIRKYKNIYVSMNENVRIPFSFWIPNQKNIVVPSSLISTENLKNAILHELQHHRQGDTKWVYVIWGFRLTFFMNPFVHLWSRRISEIQEFACDEALVDQGKVDSLAYASCLVQVAQTALKYESQPVCATGLAFLVERNFLKRRITTMLETKKTRTQFKAVLPILGLAVGVLSATAYASQGLIKDRRITLAQAGEMARTNLGNGGFPIVVNESVVKWLNYYVGTPDGREKVKAALARMDSFKGVISKKLDEYQMPEELLAVPLIEAGYQNAEAKENPSGAAGLWQFIAQTARNYGLRVDDQIDERLNVELETDAAMRYILSNKLRFKDWQLSMLSYNVGEGAVQEAIVKTGSRDPWVLVQNGLTSEEGRHYLPKLMAAILILRNQSLVQ